MCELKQIITSYESILDIIRDGKIDKNTMDDLRGILKRLKKLNDSSNRRSVVSSSFTDG